MHKDPGNERPLDRPDSFRAVFLWTVPLATAFAPVRSRIKPIKVVFSWGADVPFSGAPSHTNGSDTDVISALHRFTDRRLLCGAP